MSQYAGAIQALAVAGIVGMLIGAAVATWWHNREGNKACRKTRQTTIDRVTGGFPGQEANITAADTNCNFGEAGRP